MSNMNIVIIGLPGCGKSTLGKAVAKKLGMAFLDLDDLIRARAGKEIPQIFAEKGEDGFRTLETEAVKIASSQSKTVISTGGGTVTRQINIDLLSENGIIIFLDRSAQDICGDVRLDTRPMLQSDSQRIFTLDVERRPLYEKAAHYIVKSTNNRKESEQMLYELCFDIIRKRQFFVIGTPIEHSLSPDIHTPVLRRYLNAPSYDIKRVEPSQLGDFVKCVRDEGVSGFNITMPHKTAIIPFLDEICPQAKALNSVNTVVNINGRLKGYSTDGEGFFTALSGKGVTAKNASIVILGAGGAAGAVAAQAVKKGARCITIIARRLAPAKELTDMLYEKLGFKNAVCMQMSNEALAKSAENTDIFINATSMGMQGIDAQFESLEFLKSLPQKSIVCDLIYKPSETLLLKAAKQNGNQTMNGLGMLIYQALIADQYYLNTSLPIENLAQLVNENLQGKI